jgi:hypothetical protein
MLMAVLLWLCAGFSVMVRVTLVCASLLFVFTSPEKDDEEPRE